MEVEMHRVTSSADEDVEADIARFTMIARLRAAAPSAAVLLFLPLASDAGTQANLADRFQRLLVAQYTAIESGDTATLRTRLAEDLIWVVGVNGLELTKGQLLVAAGK